MNNCKVEPQLVLYWASFYRIIIVEKSPYLGRNLKGKYSIIKKVHFR